MIPSVLLEILFKAIGVAVGFLIPFIDAIVYALYLHPEEEQGVVVRQAWKERKVIGIFRAAESFLQLPVRFVHRGVYFLLAFVVMALFVITSTGSPVGKGVIAGLGLHILLIAWKHRKDPQAMRERLFWGLSQEVATEWYVGAIAVLGVISGLAAVL